MIAGVSEEAADRVMQQLLRDFCCLLSVRWNMEMNQLVIDGNRYAYGVNTRITASERTIKNAIGELTEHVEFLRGTANNSAEDLANYRLCRVKWKVPEIVADTTYGSEATDVQQTFLHSKRKRF